jgi:hypothetical protein
MFRAGRVMCGLSVWEMESVVAPPREEEEACSDIIEDTIDVAVCSKVCRASVGAFATYKDALVSFDTTYERWVYHLSASVGSLDVTSCDCLPNIVSRHFLLLPHYSEKWRIPSDHRARFLEPNKEVLEAIVSISTFHLGLEKRDVRFRFVCAVICPCIVPFSAQVMRCDYVYLLRSADCQVSLGVLGRRTHSAHSQFVFSRCAIHLIPKPFDVIQAINNEDGILSHLSLHSREQGASRWFL